MLMLSSLLAGNWFALKEFFFNMMKNDEEVQKWASKTYIFASVADIGAGILNPILQYFCWSALYIQI